MVEPYLVEKVTDAGIVVEDYSVDRETSKVCSEETSDKILRLTKATVDYGTARNIRSSVVTLAGKTGTAQIASKSGYQKYKQYNASFVGHFPAEEPVYSVYVMVHKPSNGTFYATWVAAPIFKEIAEKIYTISVKEPVEKAEKASNPAYTAGYYSDLKRISTVLGKSMPDDVYADVVEIIPSSLAVRPITNSNNKMPNTKGMGARDVMYLLESMGLKVKISGTGSVVKQSPIPGTLVKPNRTVYIRLN
jgi:cell division protein FtsI (penicillin-binding protein 3)